MTRKIAAALAPEGCASPRRVVPWKRGFVACVGTVCLFVLAGCEPRFGEGNTVPPTPPTQPTPDSSPTPAAPGQ